MRRIYCVRVKWRSNRWLLTRERSALFHFRSCLNSHNFITIKPSKQRYTNSNKCHRPKTWQSFKFYEETLKIMQNNSLRFGYYGKKTIVKIDEFMMFSIDFRWIWCFTGIMISQTFSCHRYFSRYEYPVAKDRPTLSMHLFRLIDLSIPCERADESKIYILKKHVKSML